MTTPAPPRRGQPLPGRPMSDRAQPGTVVGGRYELRIPIGNGGMGTVWRAGDSLLRRDVAVKEVLLPPTMPPGERDALCERTLREARAAAALSHPSVVQVYDVVTDSGRPWIVMELLEARSVADMVIDDGPLSGRTVAKIGIAMLGALEVAHAAGVLHRDVKPANVLVCTDGRCVLTDFGVARLPTESNLTTPGMVLGSPHFISPERAVGGAFGPPSDLFSLGVTLYTAIEGSPPFDRGDAFETMRAVVEDPPRPAQLAGVLEPVLWGLLDKDPARRWTVDQARANLRELLAGPLGRGNAAAPEYTESDLHTVVRPPVAPPPALHQPPANGQVGGRAMLDPNQSLSGQLAEVRRLADERGGASGESVGIGGGPSYADEPTGAGEHPRDDGPWVDEHNTSTPGEQWPSEQWPGGMPADATAVLGPALPPNRLGPTGRAGVTTWAWQAGTDDDDLDEPERRDGIGRRRAPGRGSRLVGQVLSGHGTSGRAKIFAVAGIAVLLVLTTVGLASGWFSDSTSAATRPPATSPTPRTPAIAVTHVADFRGIWVDVPKGWTRTTNGSYIDFRDPDAERKIRINVEKSAGTARRFLQTAESGLKNPSRCPAPYRQIALRDAVLGGHDGAELEYSCGSGDNHRHGVWRAVVVDGNAYHFYLTVPDSQFEASRPILDELVASFRVGSA